MRLAFLCGSLEDGRDGVGDYTRRLAAECIRRGHQSVAVALNEPRAASAQFEEQRIEEISVPVLRLPGAMPWEERIAEARTWLNDFKPDWASFQFVPFGFHRKGLCFGLGKSLATVQPKARWHLMFHELWLGLGENAPVKYRVYGALQRRIALDLVRRLRPAIVNTQADAYKIVLARDKIEAPILPLFSNIPRAEGEGWNGLLEPLVAKVLGRQPDRSELYLAGILGMVAPEWKAEEAVNTLFPLVEKSGKRLVLVFFGRSDLRRENVDGLQRALRNRADIVLAGERPGFEISKILQTIDLGIATTPRQVIQKSGSVAAMLEHGLQVLVIRDDWHLRGWKAPLAEKSAQLISPEELLVLKTLPARPVRHSGVGGVSRVAGQMLAAMESILRQSQTPADAPAGAKT